ncbi:flagellar biosynthesis protein FlgI (plasmid) [Burkholderia ubonensis]|uniref:Flagellar P-ring protein n=1 Tax=Burkholderia ubonensis TaxID=101571 RepID=A0A103RNQ0_9BURK|nr:flagellar basal body P-ring protein FlgI [Burkholderia ubonensis]AOJ64741.1 flagellar biosynthesis protein FlgI [Burkholderia ubonensis]KVG71138.1 flagellar biosynthesis protein FlgI [Burkholderia ubonensis]
MVRQILRTLLAMMFGIATVSQAQEVRLKDLGRFLGWRDNMLVGYGIVTGLSGSGDTPRSRAMRQALSNVMSQFDLLVPQDQLQSRNVAVVMVTATLPPTSDVGDKIDINVTSIGDARSLSGGTLIMTPLRAADKEIYALAQGPLSVGGYRYDANGNLAQKNHPTVGIVPAGGSVERPVSAGLLSNDGSVTFVVKNADSTTAERIASRINAELGAGRASAVDAHNVRIRAAGMPLNQLLSRVESMSVAPDRMARVVVNERTGTVVAGGDVKISAVSVTQGDIRVSVATENYASQPGFIGYGDAGVRSLIVSNSQLTVSEQPQNATVTLPHTTVSDLVQSLNRAHVTTRDIISILQAIKSAGALYADLIIE